MHVMNISNAGKNIRELRELRGWGQLELAARAGVDQSFVSRLESGQTGYSHKSLSKLAHALHVDLSVLMEKGTPSLNARHLLRTIPLLEFADVLKNKQTPGRGVQVSIDIALSERAFAVRLTGRDMEPRFQSGNEVLIDPTVKPQHECFVLAVIDGKEVVFRQFRELEVNDKREQVYSLVPLNKEFPERRSDRHDIEIRGVALFRQERLYEP